MARMRTIKPGFFANEQLAELPFSARLLFAGLWTIADRDGRLLDRPKFIKGQLFPYDAVPVDGLLSKLAEREFIRRYAVAGERLIQITTFKKHQNPHVKEAPSILPAPGDDGPSTGPSTGPAPGQHRASPVLASEKAYTSRADHGLLTIGLLASGEAPTRTEHPPEQDTAVHDQHMATPASPRVGARPPKVSRQGYDPDFEAWWSTYPRHDGKMPASLAYRDRLKAGREPHELAEAAQHFANHHEAAATPTEKIPHGSTWLHQHRDEEWEQGPPDADRVVAPRAGPPPKLAQTAAELRGLKLAREVNGDKRTSFFDLATAGVGLPDPGGAGADPRALPGPPGGPALA